MDDYLSSDMPLLPQAMNRRDKPVPPLWLSGSCVGADDVMSFCWRLYAQTQVKQTTGCQEATYLHYLTSGCSVML